MIHISGDNFTKIYYELLRTANELEVCYVNSRNGKVKDLGPAYIEISNDSFRLPILPKRAINPFFALAEYSWLITGSNKLEPLKFFIKTYGQYSDDEETLNGAYGYRLKYKFNNDQLAKAVAILKSNHTTRRVVMTMWSEEDLGSDSKDIPCNISIMLKIRDNHLDMTIINRSNDLFLGVPYNVFLFYLLQRYIAKEIGCLIGKQRHFTDSLHLYEKHESHVKQIIKSTSIEEIANTTKQFGEYDFSKYIELNHHVITELNFDNINDPYFKRLFLSFKENKIIKQGNHIIPYLPKDLLGYACYLWFSEYSGASGRLEDFLRSV